MIHHVVQFALRQRLLILLLVVFIAVGGAISFQHMPVDAYPDLSPPMVEVITQWPGHAAEEIERLVTVPTEVEMNGVPKMAVMRSISLYGLSDVIMTFEEGTDDYFARQVVFQRLSEVTYPAGVTPTLAPLASPSTAKFPPLFTWNAAAVPPELTNAMPPLTAVATADPPENTYCDAPG